MSVAVVLESPEMGRKPLCWGDLGDLNDIGERPTREGGVSTLFQPRGVEGGAEECGGRRDGRVDWWRNLE
jgi:hypothetical protein